MVNSGLCLSQSASDHKLVQLVREMGISVHLYRPLSTAILCIGLDTLQGLLSNAICKLVPDFSEPHCLKAKNLSHSLEHAALETH